MASPRRGEPNGRPGRFIRREGCRAVRSPVRPVSRRWIAERGDREEVDGVRTGLPFDDVLAAAQAGAAWAFERLYRELAPAVTGYLRLHGAVEPDDLASETFLGVFTGLATFSGDEAGLRAWVFTIAHRRLMDDWRRRSRRPQLADEPGDLTAHLGGDVEDDVLTRLGAETVHRLCGELPTDQRSVLLLRILADLTVEQVADVLDKSVPSVKALQRRGLRALRDRLERENSTERVGAPRAPFRTDPAMTRAR
nr:sigma-70 family RNA polymerase sigma factor [Petropleomorpha daqingensis]